MWTDLLRSHQTLHRNWIVIKVAFGSVKKHDVRHSRSRWDLPLSTRERYLWAPRVIRIRKCMVMLGLRVNQGFRITGSRKRGRLQARPNIVRQREQHIYMTLWRLVWYDLYVCIGVDMSCYRPLSTIGPSKSTRAMSIRMWTHRVTHLSERSLIGMRSELDWT